MLYDPKWETKADPFALASLIAWLETQDPAATYDYCSASNCVLCQYFKAMGFKEPLIAKNNLHHAAGSVDFPKVLWKVAHYDIRGWTFGGALQAARTAIASAE